MTPLYAEMNRWAALRYQWGKTDCATLCADWIMAVRGVDPAADIRLTYGTAGECQRALKFFTDPVGAVGRLVEAAGLMRTDRPVPGDVGVILDRATRGPHVALCLGKAWAVKAQDGAVVAFDPLKVLAAWGVGYAHP